MKTLLTTNAVAVSPGVAELFDLRLAPPHALMEDKACYSLVFNMLGIEQRGIGIDLNLQKREMTVLARKERNNLNQGFYWVFGVPRDGALSKMTTRFKAGVLEIVIPKCAVAITS